MALRFGVTILLCALANGKPLLSLLKEKKVPLSVYNLLASVWAQHWLCTSEIPQPPNFRQDGGLEISGKHELPVEWYT